MSLGRIPWNKGKKGLFSGDKSPSWKGGSFISSDGYKMIKINTDRGWAAYKKEHKILVEKNIGRAMLKEEVIHHIDGDKLNNKLDNLQLCSSDKEHRDLHNSLERIAFQLVRSGLIEFNKQTNSYVSRSIL